MITLVFPYHTLILLGLTHTLIVAGVETTKGKAPKTGKGPKVEDTAGGGGKAGEDEGGKGPNVEDTAGGGRKAGKECRRVKKIGDRKYGNK
jgi:hypothetical protein